MALRFARLDRAAIRRLAGGEWKSTEKGKRYWVGAKLVEHGIIVERLADGDLRYSVNIMVDGQRCTGSSAARARGDSDAGRGIYRTGAHRFPRRTACSCLRAASWPWPSPRPPTTI